MSRRLHERQYPDNYNTDSTGPSIRTKPELSVLSVLWVLCVCVLCCVCSVVRVVSDVFSVFWAGHCCVADAAADLGCPCIFAVGSPLTAHCSAESVRVAISEIREIYSSRNVLTVQPLPLLRLGSPPQLHLGHNIPDDKGPRLCINLVCVSGFAPEE